MLWDVVADVMPPREGVVDSRRAPPRRRERGGRRALYSRRSRTGPVSNHPEGEDCGVPARRRRVLPQGRGREATPGTPRIQDPLRGRGDGGDLAAAILEELLQRSDPGAVAHFDHPTTGPGQARRSAG